jgi:hypothetical protein
MENWRSKLLPAQRIGDSKLNTQVPNDSLKLSNAARGTGDHLDYRVLLAFPDPTQAV